MCWKYSPRSAKPLLNFNSGHSKVIKNGIAFSCLRSALVRSCFHQMRASFSEQVTRLTDAGFPDTIIRQTVHKLTKRVKLNADNVAAHLGPEQRKSSAVLPYIHKLSHNLKNVASRFGVSVVFSSPNKLNRVCGIVERKLKNRVSGVAKEGCGVKHVTPFVQCRKGVVYLLPFSCGRVYIGQTSRCINIRLMEHRRSLQGNVYSHVAQHVAQCHCAPIFHEAEVLSTHPDQTTREIIEAYNIRKRGEQCISVPSVALHDSEVRFLDSTVS